MKAIVTLILCLILANGYAYSPSFMRQPTISPDGEMVCFNYMSDLWIVPFNGGEAKRITLSDGDDGTPFYSPDGKWIAFSSNRQGFRGVYRIPADGGKAELITREAYMSISDWYPDSSKLLGTRFSRGTGTGQYAIYLDGRRVEEITPISNHFSKLSPDQRKIIFNMRGYPYRPAYSGSIAGNLWEYDIKNKSYTQLTFTDTTERYPVYSQVNPYIYFGGSDGNRFQLYRVANYDFENRKQLTFFEKQSLRNLSIARNNDRMVFERFDKLWRYDPVKDKAEEIDITIKQDFLSSFKQNEALTNTVNDAAVSPNGKLIAFSYKYDLFAMPEIGGEVKQLTFDQKGIGDILILDDNRTIYFTKRDKGSYLLFSVDINKPDEIVKNYWSEGKYIRHIYPVSARYMAIHYKIDEDSWRVAMMDVNTKEISDIIQDYPVWSWFLTFAPELDYAFYTTGEPPTWSRHLHLYDINNKTSTRLLSSMNYMGGLYLGYDNESLFFTLNNELVRLDLLPKPDFRKRKDNWEDILDKKEEEEALVETVYPDPGEGFRLQLEGLETRITTLSKRPGTNIPVHIVSDSTLYYVNRNGNRYSIRSINYWGGQDKEITSINGSINSWTTAFYYNTINKHFYVVMDNQLLKINAANGKFEPVKNRFEYEFDEIELNKSVFDEMWVEFGSNFYDRTMHGRDWDEMYDRFRPFVDHTYRVEYLSYIISEMIGELDASHTGFTPRRDDEGSSYELAYTGFTLDFSTVSDRGIPIRSVYLGSTAYQRYGVRTGDVLLSVDGVEITPRITISDLFEDKVGKQIKMRIRTANGIRDLTVRGLTAMQEYELFYEDMVAERRALTESLSNGRIGYLHIPQMRQDKIDPFNDDLFARNYDKDAVVIDVRGNSGGNISRQLLDILSRKPRAYTTSRGYPDQLFDTPNRIWDKPLILLIDQNSFSDAEIFPILFRQKGLGKVVGMPTGGGVIGTTPYTLMDGSTLRMPRTGWFTKEGINMEGTGAEPDILIDMTPENILNKDDVQLQRAVRELLQQLGN